MNLFYMIVIKLPDSPAPFVKTFLTKDKDGKSGLQRAEEAALAAAGTGGIIQSVNLTAIDVDLTT